MFWLGVSWKLFLAFGTMSQCISAISNIDFLNYSLNLGEKKED